MGILEKLDLQDIAARAIWAVVDGDELLGICLACGAEHDEPVEPDTHGLKCRQCGADRVTGAEEIVLQTMGWKRP